jgi:hypothetical protein
MCFQAPLSHQRAFVVQYVKQHTIDNMFSLGTTGKHPANFFRLPVIEASSTLANFLRRYPVLNMTSMLETSFGKVARGIAFLGRLFQTMDPVATLKGVKGAGGIVRSRLTAPETVALQLAAGITITARISINRFLASILGAPVFADERECKKVELVNIPPTYHAT